MSSTRFHSVLFSTVVGILIPATIFLASCSTENPVSPETDCTHVDGEGLLVASSGGTVMASQWLLNVDGGLTTIAGEESDRLTVRFLDPDSNAALFVDNCTDHSLRWTGLDTSIARIELWPGGGKYDVTVRGVAPGSTSVRFLAWHAGDHADFTSQPISIVVEGGLGTDTANGLRIVDGTETLVEVWGDAATGVVSDSLRLAPNVTTSRLQVVWLNSDSLPIVQPLSSLSASIADPTVAQVVDVSTTGLQLAGVNPGVTTLSLLLGTYPAPLIPIAVREPVASGVVVYDDGLPVTTVWQGAADNAMTLPDGWTNYGLSIEFLGADSLPLPSLSGYTVDVAPSNSSQLIVSPDGDTWTITARQMGTTDILVRLLDGSTEVFTATVPVDVAAHQPWPSPVASVGRNDNMMASWNYDPVRAPNEAIGTIVAEMGTTLSNLTVIWHDSIDVALGLGLDTLQPLDSRYQASWELSNPSLASLDSVDKWTRDLVPLQTGNGTLTVRLQFDGSDEIVAGPFRLIVRDTHLPGSDTASGIITYSGAWMAVVNGDSLLTDGTYCAKTLNGGFASSAVPLRPGVLSALYKYWLPNPSDSCVRDDSWSTNRYELIFDFTDPGIANTLYHPIHWGERQIFHLLGLNPGTTSVKIHFVDKQLNVVTFTTPLIPVEVIP